MAYDEDIAHRIRESLQGESGLTEKAMFGGLSFLVDGNMAVCASGKGGVLLRVDKAEFEALLKKPHAERAFMGGREMKGWLHLDAAVTDSDAEFDRWVGRGVAYARSLPPK